MVENMPNFNVFPSVIKGSKGVFHLQVKNTGDLSETFSFKAEDLDGLCNYEFNMQDAVVPPGGSAEVLLTVSFKTGRPNQVCTFTIHKTDRLGQVEDLKARLESKTGVPAWAPIAGGAALVVVVAVAVALAGGGDKSPGSSSNITTTNPPVTSVTTQPPTTTATPTTTLPPTTTATVPPLSLSAGTLTAGQVSQTYTTEIKPSGGKAPYTFTPIGTIPAGLKITGLDDRCRVEGTPTEYGEFTFSISVKDSIATTTPVNAAFKLTVIPNLNGNWTFNTTVTAAGGVCSDEVGSSSSRTIKFEQNGLKIIMSGFVGNPSAQLNGDIFTPSSSSGNGKWVITVTGSYPEDGGTTTSTRTFTLNSPATMTGTEDWTWSGPGGSCPGGKATMTVQKAA